MTSAHLCKINTLFQLIDFVFHGGNKTFIKVSTKGKAFWDKKVKDCIRFTCNSLKLLSNI